MPPLLTGKLKRNYPLRQICRNETLTRFDAQIQHIPRISNSAADALSHYPYVQSEEGREATISAISIVEFDPNIVKAIRMSYPEDSLFAPVIKNPEWYPLFQVNDGLLFFEG